jgi:hypothetical protein
MPRAFNSLSSRNKFAKRHSEAIALAMQDARFRLRSTSLDRPRLSKPWLQLWRYDAAFGQEGRNRAEEEIRDRAAPQRCADRQFDTDDNCKP